MANLTRNGPPGLINSISLDNNPLITDVSGINLMAAASYLSGFQSTLSLSHCGLSDGTALASATGGAGGYSYLWSAGAASTAPSG